MTLASLVPPAAGVTLGAIAGSFLATLAIRWERGQSIVRGRSSCDACDSPLNISALVPIVSFLRMRGRCMRCGAAVDPRHIVIEVACAMVGGVALVLDPGRAGWAGAGFGWLLVTLGAIDAACFWLPDRLTFTLALTGLIAGVARAGSPPLETRIAGLVVGLVAMSTLRMAYRRLRGREGMGGGDAKLFGAIGAWLGWQPLPTVALIAATAGLIWAGIRALRGHAVSRLDRLPLGTLLAGAGWMSWVISILAVNFASSS